MNEKNIKMATKMVYNFFENILLVTNLRENIWNSQNNFNKICLK